MNNIEAVGKEIVFNERNGKFIYNVQLRVDLNEVERITNMEMTEQGLFPSIHTRYYAINKDMKLCIENIKFQIKNKRVREFVNIKNT